MTPAGLHVWCFVATVLVGLLAPTVARSIAAIVAPYVLRAQMRKYLDRTQFTPLVPNGIAPEGSLPALAFMLKAALPGERLTVFRKRTAPELTLGTVRVTFEIGVGSKPKVKS